MADYERSGERGDRGDREERGGRGGYRGRYNGGGGRGGGRKRYRGLFRAFLFLLDLTPVIREMDCGAAENRGWERKRYL